MNLAQTEALAPGMFVDFRDQPPPPPPPWQPQPRRRAVSKRERRVIYAKLWINLALLVLAPIGGATLLGLVFTWLR